LRGFGENFSSRDEVFSLRKFIFPLTEAIVEIVQLFFEFISPIPRGVETFKRILENARGLYAICGCL